MKKGIRSLVAVSAVFTLTVPATALQAQQLPPQSSVNSAAVLCVDEIKDQSTGTCFQASSIPTLGLLFPYPGFNNVFTPQAFVGGGRDNTASESFATATGGRNNTASGYYATVGGGVDNTADDRATVAGGHNNTASGHQATIGGGSGNLASGADATIGGGTNNTAGIGATVGGGGGYYGNKAFGGFSTVGGGIGNEAYGGGATVAGGAYNRASGYLATVGGGGGDGYYQMGNAAAGDFATIPGGHDNSAQGDYSFAAGRRAIANHLGSFVWGDSQNVDKPSSVADEFNVYCSGGARFFSNSAAWTGVLLAPGGGSWTAVSDRDSKENLEPIDARDVLERVVALPLSTWNYKAQSDSIRHMGPMAQDFYAAFGLGLGDTTIDTIDPDGVALAAIQGLNETLIEKLAEKDAEIAAMSARIRRLEELALRLEAQVDDR